MAAACSIEGCGEEVIARGLCCRHYHRLRRYGNPLKIFRRPPGMTLEEAVEYELGRAVRDGDCLITQGSRYPSGYGRLIMGRRHHALSRLVLERKLGRRLRRDEVTRHLCHNPPCIEPRHFVPVSRADIAKDTINADRQSCVRGEAHPNAKLVDQLVREIRARYAAGGISQRELADEMGISRGALQRVVDREGWSHVR